MAQFRLSTRKPKNFRFFLLQILLQNFLLDFLKIRWKGANSYGQPTFSFRLTVGIGVTVMTVTTLIAVVEHEYAHADPALIGLALSYAIPLTSIISSFMQDFLSTELGFVSVERIKQYSNLKSKCQKGLCVNCVTSRISSRLSGMSFKRKLVHHFF